MDGNEHRVNGNSRKPGGVAWLERRKLDRSLGEKIVARTAELEASQDRLQQLSREAKRAEQRERERLAGGLHDEVQQLLVAARMSLEPFAEESPQLQKAYDCLGRALKTTRTLIFDLFPVILYTEGLQAAIRDLCGRMQDEHGLEVTVTDRTVGKLDEDLRVDLYYAVRELLFNVVKHADVNEAEVNLEKTDRTLLITVRDRGRGFETGSQHKSGYGLLSVEKNFREHGGAVDISSAEGEGTQVRLIVPLESGS